MRPSTKMIINHLEGASDNYKVLDVGCGKGRDLRKVMEAFPNIEFHAIDMEDTRKYLPDNLNFKIGKVNEIREKFKDTKFDMVICQHVLEHLVYPVDAVLEFKSVLKDGGLIFIESPNWTRLFIPFHRNFFWNDTTHVRPFTKKSYISLCNFSGVKKVDIKVKSSHGLLFGIKNAFSAKNPITFIKRLIDAFINPLLMDNIILVAKKHEK